MDKVIIKDLLAVGIIGVNEWERIHPQQILINLTLYTDTWKAGKSDNIEDCVSYSIIGKKVLAHAETAARKTVEALAADLANICLEDPRVKKVTVRVEKPRAVTYTGSVGVEIERERGIKE
ncbi:MAG: dihydroneopterin aldolase [Chloroflexi bacterium]|nr:dihydroneopterin aldolase [Chloroflexota bacterium]